MFVLMLMTVFLECRLADTLSCSRGSGRNACLQESRECYLTLLTQNGCDPVLPCNPPERQALISTVKDSLQCHLEYPDYVVADLEEEDERRHGLQVCKDIILSGCLADWSADPGSQDFINFVNMEPDFQAQICQQEAGQRTLSCLVSAINGTVTYNEQEYNSPCDVKLMVEQSAEVLQQAVNDLYLTYGFTCSANVTDLCESKVQLLSTPANETGIPEEAPEEKDEMAIGDDKGMPTDPEIPPEDDTEMEEIDHTDHTDHDHSSHDHADDDKMMETKEETETKMADDEHKDDHKHPGPVGKATKEDNSALQTSAGCGLVSLLVLAAMSLR